MPYGSAAVEGGKKEYLVDGGREKDSRELTDWKASLKKAEKF